jgi:exodeoxyribonuclease VII large subunit
MVVEREDTIREGIRSLEARLAGSMNRALELLRVRVRECSRLIGDPRRRLEQYGQRMDDLLHRMALELRHRLRRERAGLTALTSGLDHLSPLGILSRGYSITRKLPTGAILKNAADARSGDLISTRLHQGEVLSRVEKPDFDTRQEL